jgi:hypothetical protein
MEIRQAATSEIRQSDRETASDRHERTDKEPTCSNQIELPKAESPDTSLKREQQRSVQKELGHELKEARDDQDLDGQALNVGKFLARAGDMDRQGHKQRDDDA